MKIFIRADSSFQIGSGHIVRCLTLACKLRKYGGDVVFICRELPGNLCDLIEKTGFTVQKLPYSRSGVGEDPIIDAVQTKKVLQKSQAENLLVVDHYALDAQWELQVRPFVKLIMVIDDLANRMHDCDILLDQNLYLNMESRYENLVPGRCLKFLGPRYALLRQEFIEARTKLRKREGIVKNMLIFFGGSDVSNWTAKAITAVSQLNRDDIVTEVIVGLSNPHKEEIQQECSTKPNFRYHCHVNNFSEFIAGADLAIGAGGSSTWERCYLGLPSITVVIADNQYETTQAVAEAGATLNLGHGLDVGVTELFNSLREIINNQDYLVEMSQKATGLMGEKFIDLEHPVVKSILEVVGH